VNWAPPFSLIAFAVLVLITLLRARSALKKPSRRLAWFATLSGCAAFATVGVVIPLSLLDGWVGGTNVVNLLRASFATTAFWFLMQASRTLDGSKFDRRSLWELPTMLVAFVIPFMLIPDRGPSSESFIKLHADKVELWAYASIYMACVVFIMWRLLSGIRGRAPWPYVLIRVGSWAIAAASLLEIAYLTMRWLQVEPRAFVNLVGQGFALPFYGGVVLAAIGLAAFAFMSRAHAALRLLLLRANVNHGLPRSEVDEAEDGAYDTFRLAVRLADVANSEPLTRSERVILAVATRVLDRQISVPTLEDISGHPEVVPAEGDTAETKSYAVVTR
jgi:hypothetical protein